MRIWIEQIAWNNNLCLNKQVLFTHRLCSIQLHQYAQYPKESEWVRVRKKCKEIRLIDIFIQLTLGKWIRRMKKIIMILQIFICMVFVMLTDRIRIRILIWYSSLTGMQSSVFILGQVVITSTTTNWSFCLVQLNCTHLSSEDFHTSPS